MCNLPSNGSIGVNDALTSLSDFKVAFYGDQALTQNKKYCFER